MSGTGKRVRCATVAGETPALPAPAVPATLLPFPAALVAPGPVPSVVEGTGLPREIGAFSPPRRSLAAVGGRTHTP